VEEMERVNIKVTHIMKGILSLVAMDVIIVLALLVRLLVLITHANKPAITKVIPIMKETLSLAKMNVIPVHALLD